MKNIDISLLNNLYSKMYTTKKLFGCVQYYSADNDLLQQLPNLNIQCDAILSKCTQALSKLQRQPSSFTKLQYARIYAIVRIKLWLDKTDAALNQIVLKYCFDNIVDLLKLYNKSDPNSIYNKTIQSSLDIFENTISLLKCGIM
jgi:hypothetical protein